MFFAPVKKLRRDYNTLKHFWSISCLMTMSDYGHISPKQVCDLVKKTQHFWHTKPDSTLFHGFSASQPSSSAKNEQNMTLQLRQNSGESYLVTLIHKSMPKFGCFGAFSHFFCFWGTFLEKLEPIICFFIHQMWDEISIPNDWYLPQVYIKRNF